MLLCKDCGERIGIGDGMPCFERSRFPNVIEGRNFDRHRQRPCKIAPSLRDSFGAMLPKYVINLADIDGAHE